MHLPEPFLSWMIRSTGLFGMLIPPLAIVCFVLTLLIAIRGKGSRAGIALVLIIPLPVLLGFFCLVYAGIQSLQVIFHSTVPPKSSELGDAISTALVAPMMGLLLSLPSYLVGSAAMFVRSLSESSDRIEPAE